MLLVRHNTSLPDLDASSSLRLRYPSYNTIPSKQFTSSPSEEILSDYVHTTLPSQPPFFMYSSSQDQRDESLVDPWLHSTAGPSAGLPQSADTPSALAAPKSTHSPPSHAVNTTASLGDPTHHSRFLHSHTPGGSPSPRHQSFPSQQHPSLLNRHVSEPNIRSAAAQPAPHYPLSSVPEARYPQQQRRRQQQQQQPHHQTFQHSVTPVLPSPTSASFSVDRRPSTAGSAASSGWERRGDTPLHGVTAVTAAQDLPPIATGDQNPSPLLRYPPAFSNPFGGEHHVSDARPRSSGVGAADPLHHHPETAHSRLQSSASSLYPITRPVAPEEELDTAPPDPTVSKTYSFVSLPGNAVRKRPRRRYDEIERLYHCSWTGCTKSYGTLNHLNAHIVMQRHGSKRTPAEFKELRKQWRKAKKDESDRQARQERAEERFSMRSEHAPLQYPPQHYERQSRSVSYGRQPLYGPGMPGPEMEHQLAVSEATTTTTARYPLSAETSSMRPQPLQQQYGYPISGASHSLYTVVPTTPMSSSWPEQPTQYEGTTPPQHGTAPGNAHLSAQAVYEYERERGGQSWTPPSLPASRPAPSYDVSSSYTQPQAQQRYQPSTVEPEFEEEYESKHQFWPEQQH
ncbi:hypothetical protein BC827DRAFT_1174391 [Russula dissimulans]|nr:hypothetical protein BC827DRAFT_1174391 [Russula dissimulans]